MACGRRSAALGLLLSRKSLASPAPPFRGRVLANVDICGYIATVEPLGSNRACVFDATSTRSARGLPSIPIDRVFDGRPSVKRAAQESQANPAFAGSSFSTKATEEEGSIVPPSR